MCRFGWLCEICKKYTFRSKFQQSIESIKQNHICGNFKCKFCGEVYQEKIKHQCKFYISNQPDFLSKLAFFDLAMTGGSAVYCQDCFALSKSTLKQVCTFCLDNDTFETNICSILFETQRELFSRATFGNFFPTIVEKNIFTYAYLSPNCRTRTNKQKTFFNQNPKNLIDSNLFKKKEMSPLEKMLDFIFVKELFFTTFVTHDDANGRILEEVLKTFLSNGIIPNIVGSPKIMFLEIKQIGLRFLNSLNYFDSSIFALTSKFSLEHQFFPHRWNKAHFFCYEGPPPTKADFFCAEDSVQICQAKATFLNKLKENRTWKFADAIIKYSNYRLQVTQLAVLKFCIEAYSCQQLLNQEIFPSNKELFFIMPFNPPLFTKASYAFQLLLHYTESHFLKNIRPPIRMQSSKQELEFCSFLRWKFPHYQFIDAWSPFGQKTFRESFPDSYCPQTKTAFFFNGCLIHGHPKSECKFKRKSKGHTNYFKVPLETALQQYKNKVNLLLQNHPNEVISVETIWECCWKTQKKEDTTLKYFMTKIYNEPPLSRLDATKAGMQYTILESCHLFHFYLIV